MSFLQGDWKLSLRTSFKNFRKDHKEDADENGVQSGSRKRPASTPLPPSKRMRIDVDDDDMDEEEYEDLVVELAEEWRKDKKDRSMATIKDLFVKTCTKRQYWITKQQPALRDVLAKFPCLSSSRTVRMNSQY